MRIQPRAARKAKPQLPIFAPPMPHALFRCEPLGARLSRANCGARHKEARAKGVKGKVALVTGTCARCEVGAAHAKGGTPQSWPDGGKVRELAVVPKVGTERTR